MEKNIGDQYTETYRKCAAYFIPKRGLCNDFYFYGSEMEPLKKSDRIEMEQKTIECCKRGDNRYFPALKKVKFFNLNEIFTGRVVRSIQPINTRIKLLNILYEATHNPDYLHNLLWLCACNSLAYYYVNQLLCGKDKEEETERWKTDDYRMVRHALKTINMIRGNAGKDVNNAMFMAFGKTDYLAVEMLDRKEIRKMMRLNPWHFDDSYDHFLFYNALMRRQNYMERENLNDIRDIIYHALIHPEVYDVLWYMKSQGEIDEKMIRAANAPRSAESRDQDAGTGNKKKQQIEWERKKSLFLNSGKRPGPNHLQTEREEKKQSEENELKKELIDQAVIALSPEAKDPYPGIRIIFELAKIEWNSPGEYHRFMGVIKKEKACWESEVHGFLDYARHLDSWDYNTCLAYIIYIQRSDYASGGFTHIFGDMAANGTIKKVLVRMKSLLENTIWER